MGTDAGGLGLGAGGAGAMLGSKLYEASAHDRHRFQTAGGLNQLAEESSVTSGYQ